MQLELEKLYDLQVENGRFRVGDVVYKESDQSTHMTITKIGKMKVEMCAGRSCFVREVVGMELEWFDHRGEKKQGVFECNHNLKHVLTEYEGFKIGDTVRLKSDKSVLMTVISIGDSEKRKIYAQWFDMRGNLHEKEFLPSSLTHANTLAKIPIYKAKDFEFYGLKIYSSLLANSFGKTDLEAEKSTRFVYNFKKEGRNKSEVSYSLDLVKKAFDCQTIVSVPSRSPAPNELQKLFGQIITRLEELAPRKYAHNKPLVENYEGSYRIDFEKIKGKILLVDDVITSGETIRHFSNRLESEGFEVVKFALGLDHKLEPYQYKEFFYAL